MRQRSFVILVAAVAFLLVGSVGVYAYDSAHDNQIASGVKAGGVDIGGLKTSASALTAGRCHANTARPLDRRACAWARRCGTSRFGG